MSSLYHYTDFMTAKRFILKNQCLKLSPISKTNDPRENKSFRFGYIRYSSGEDLPEYKHNSYYETFTNELLRKDIKVLCFSTDYVIDDDGYLGYNLSRMWATYGNNHRGVCFQINLEKFINANRDKINDTNFKKVNYIPPGNNFDVTTAEEIGIEDYCRLFIQEHHDYFYFTKLMDWHTEHEMRLIYNGNESVKEFCTIENCLESVILGINASKYKIKKIGGLVPQGIPLWKAEFELDRIKLDRA
jgi:hypothetical protein